MVTYLVRRLLLMLPTLVGITLPQYQPLPRA
jgi:ABC-type microcin C transport system permease subunit YejB